MKTHNHILITAMLVSLLFGLAGPASGFYDPTVQRWINRDPSPPADSENHFAFVLNAPLDGMDPDGRVTVESTSGDVTTTACPICTISLTRCLFEAWRYAQDNCDLTASFAGKIVRTGKTGRATLVLNNGSRLTVAENSWCATCQINKRPGPVVGGPPRG
jgi:hypothetical protein